MIKITPELLVQAMNCLPERAERFAAHLNDACWQYGISENPARLAAFLAQIGHESGNLRYTAEVWGPTPAQTRYEGRRDLGNTQPGDGFRYRGRGLIQTTGRANYRALSERIRGRFTAELDFEAEPELLEADRWAAFSAADYWDLRGLNALADAGDFLAITKRINGGTNGLEDRQARHRRALAALQVLPPQEDQPPPAPIADNPPPAAPAPQPEKPAMPLPLFALPAIASLVQAVPDLIRAFGKDGEKAEKNAKAAELVLTVAKEAIGAPNEQALVEKLQQDPAAVQQVRAAVVENWHQITMLTEVGGGIAAARAANAAAAASGADPKRNLALWITLLLLPLVYMTVGAVLFGEGWSQDVRAMVVAAVVSGLLGGITGYWLGTSFSSAKKDEQRAAGAPS